MHAMPHSDTAVVYFINAIVYFYFFKFIILLQCIATCCNKMKYLLPFISVSFLYNNR